MITTSPLICGLFYIKPNTRTPRQFLPLVDIEAHTTILETTSRTKLTQTYFNPSEVYNIPELQYTFPLYDGVSVVGFICRIGDRRIVGQVKEKEKAKKVFKDAVARGEKAALLEQLPEASDVFTTTVGNVPAGATVVVEITYMGELKHDAEVDGIRFTIPTKIMPRYGNYPVELAKGKAKHAAGRNIRVTVDVVMAEKSFIKQIQSPSHPIAVSLGINSFAPKADPVMYKASAVLNLESAGLEKDFIIIVAAKDTGIPTAILETHPTIPNQRALMTTLVPRFALPPEKPEVVFICDRSGSMSGSRIQLVKSALKVFLKSIPVGAKFNICSFGSSYSFLWKKSQTYSQSTLDEAINYVNAIEANMGGTEMFQPIKATFDRRYKDIPLEVMLLTDGEIWDQDRLFAYLNAQVIENKAAARVFTLGIGNGVSHALIEGVAKAGNGFSQSVGEGEKMESKVVRMLKGALTPHVVDYTLEVKYSNEDRMTDVGKDDYEIVEKVTDSLKVNLDLAEKKRAPHTVQKPISLFDTSVDPDEDIPVSNDETGESRYSHLPLVLPPKLLQAPHIIPPLYAFNRTCVYLLMGPESSHLKPKSVVLRGTSRHGPLQLEIPIQILDTPGETIHQLAARKAIAELEQGRGWITQAVDSSGVLLKDKHESQFSDMVEREAVRLGVQFQVQGKWSSFVAVENQQENEKAKEKELLSVTNAAVPPPSYTTTMYSQQSAAPPSSSQLYAYQASSLQGGGTRASKSRSWGLGSIGSVFRSRSSASSISSATPYAPSAASYTPSAASYALSTASQTSVGAESAAPTFGSATPTFTSTTSGFGSITPTGVDSGPSPRRRVSSGYAIQPVPGSAPPAPPPPPPGMAYSSPAAMAMGAPYPSCPPPPMAMGMPHPSCPPPPMAMAYSSDLPASFAPMAIAKATPYSSHSPPAPSHPTASAIYSSYSEDVELNADEDKEEEEDLQTEQMTSVLKSTVEQLNQAGNVQRILERGEKLESLSSTADDLSASSMAFNSSAKKSKRSSGFGSLFSKPSSSSSRKSEVSESKKAFSKPVLSGSKLEILVELQTFEGCWEWEEQLFSCINILLAQAEKMAKDNGWDQKVVATALAIAYFEKKLAKEKDTWELVTDKAKGWLEGQIGQDQADAALEKAKELIV
ncbi:hypothetical protein BGX21_003797 [Mortierella sp. AD011]|nr:hypothetical protein BGX20_003066 [Mortierella sp. AD010]KAF9400646.1 hypothetical protein BGX21_003797 [Mortierella sp. AD011]